MLDTVISARQVEIILACITPTPAETTPLKEKLMTRWNEQSKTKGKTVESGSGAVV